MHPNVVFGNILTGLGLGLRHGEVDVPRESVWRNFARDALQPIAFVTITVTLGRRSAKSRHGKIKQDDKGEFVLKEIVNDVG